MTVRPAVINDLASIVGWYRQGAAPVDPANTPCSFVFSPENHDKPLTLQERILDRCLLVAEKQGCLFAAAGIDLDRAGFSELIFSSATPDHGLFASLVAETERLAVRFGLQHLTITPVPAAERRFRALGYTTSGAGATVAEALSAGPPLCLQRSLRRRQTRYGRRVGALGAELGIPADYGRQHRLALQPEATRLSHIGKDVFGREQQLAPPAAMAWQRMQTAAAAQGIELQAVSAWRSVSYQCEVLRRKLAKGLSMEEILQVSAAPGFSEHHSGYAIDITTPGCAVLEEAFEQSPAFRWLERHAREFSFRLSFPRHNRHHLAYEPWHWCFDG
jgi:D-alanyl-D-alanine carboxypeptidase